MAYENENMFDAYVEHTLTAIVAIHKSFCNMKNMVMRIEPFGSHINMYTNVTKKVIHFEILNVLFADYFERR